MVTGSSVGRAVRYLDFIRILYRDYCRGQWAGGWRLSLRAIERAQYCAGSSAAPAMIGAHKREEPAFVGVVEAFFQQLKLLLDARQGLGFDMADRMQPRCNLPHGTTMFAIA